MNHVHPIKPGVLSLLLADDDRDDHDFFREDLKKIAPSIKVTTVKDGAELMQVLAYYIPDILFPNLDMPLKNGLECLREIRGSKGTKDLPVVVFSSSTRSVNIDTAYDPGADLFFIKPSLLVISNQPRKRCCQLNGRTAIRCRSSTVLMAGILPICKFIPSSKENNPAIKESDNWLLWFAKEE